MVSRFGSRLGYWVVLASCAALPLAGCEPGADDSAEGCEDDTDPEDGGEAEALVWNLAMSWPEGLDVLSGNAARIAERVTELSGGSFTIQAHFGGAPIGGALEVLQTVGANDNDVQIGHTASYYYVGVDPAFAFDTTVPFGLDQRQQNAWLAQGNDSLDALFAEHNLVRLAAGNTGTQMGGWFVDEVDTVADLQGLRVRIPGLGGAVMARLGASVQTVAGGDIVPSLMNGSLDAAEWVGPHDDERLGLPAAADHYYYPGWWEPGPAMALMINKTAWEGLTDPQRAMLTAAAGEANAAMMAEYDAKNAAALQRILDSGVEVHPFSDEILDAARTEAFAYYDELAAADPTSTFALVYEDWKAFKESSDAWHATAETAYANAR